MRGEPQVHHVCLPWSTFPAMVQENGAQTGDTTEKAEWEFGAAETAGIERGGHLNNRKPV